MSQVLNNIVEVKQKILAGKKLLLAGDEKVMSQLPKGQWIGGTIPYFMGDEGGVFSQETVFVTELPEYVNEVIIREYDETTIQSVYRESADSSFCVIIIPASCKTHFSFALNAPNYEEFAATPLIGWIAGVNLTDLGKVSPKVFNGQTGEVVEDGALVMNVRLPKDKIADIGIINVFNQGVGDTISFGEDSFTIRDAYINGVKKNLADYVSEENLDTKLPLVADYYGAMVNISFQGVDNENKETNFYAPVFSGIAYKHAASVQDYVTQFMSQVPDESTDKVMFSCNCILNYLYSELEGKNTGIFKGPITFGEIAYQLLNQTLVYLTIIDIG